jgi:periplasmic nitrate reductase NapD
MNVSSHVIKVAPENLDTAVDSLKQSGLCDVFFHDPQGTIVVTVEGRDIGEEMDKMKEIQKLPFVLSVALAYCYNETGQNEAALETPREDGAVPDALRGA